MILLHYIVDICSILFITLHGKITAGKISLQTICFNKEIDSELSIEKDAKIADSLCRVCFSKQKFACRQVVLNIMLEIVPT